MTSDGSPFTLPPDCLPGRSDLYSYEYQFTPPGAMNEEDRMRLRGRFNDLLQVKTSEYEGLVHRKKMSIEDAADAALHDVLSQLAAEFQCPYYRILKRHGYPPWLESEPGWP